MNREFAATIRRELGRLARFGANLSDAYSCLIFLPSSLLSDDPSTPADDTLVMAGAHTLSNDLVKGCRLPRGNGLIGWVAKHRRSIHVSPFDRDSSTLGIYGSDQQLKSFIGIPILLPGMNGPDAEKNDSELTGVVTCDSKKSFSFSKLQGKLLEELSDQISSVINLAHSHHRRSGGELSWDNFMRNCSRLLSALGPGAVEVLRLKVLNLDEIEATVGSARSVDLLEQVHRLIQQALPPHFPSFRMPNGDITLVVDNMMASFYENRIRAICEHITRPGGTAAGSQGDSLPAGTQLAIDFSRRSFRGRREKDLTLERLIAESAVAVDPSSGKAAVNGTPSKGIYREYRTA